MSVPAARPVLVGPAEHEWKVRLTRTKHLVEGSFEEPPSVEPVVVVTKAIDAVFLGQFCLCRAGLWETQVVEAEVGWKVRLVVVTKPRRRPDNVRPLGETRAPPFVVLWNRMVLR